MRIFFSSIIDASVNLVRGFPLRVKKKTKWWIYASILKILRCCFSETRGNLALYVTALSRHVHLMCLSTCLWCCCLKRKLRIVFYPRLILFPIILYFYFDGWQQLKYWAYKVSHDKTKNLYYFELVGGPDETIFCSMYCSGWYSLTTTNTIFETQKRVSFIHFVQLKQETRNPSKNVAYFIISD